jgi:hypothetical protein
VSTDRARTIGHGESAAEKRNAIVIENHRHGGSRVVALGVHAVDIAARSRLLWRLATRASAPINYNKVSAS